LPSRKLGDTRLTRSASTSALPVAAGGALGRSPRPTPRASVSGMTTPHGHGHRRSRSGLFGMPPRPPLDTRTLTPTDARFLRSSIFSPDLSPEDDVHALSPPTPTAADSAAAAAAGSPSRPPPPKDERERLLQQIIQRSSRAGTPTASSSASPSQS